MANGEEACVHTNSTAGVYRGLRLLSAYHLLGAYFLPGMWHHLLSTYAK